MQFSKGNVSKLPADTNIFLPAGGSHTLSIKASDKRQLYHLSLSALLIMDDLRIELGTLENLEDDNDSSDDNSSKRGKKYKLPLVNPVCVGELYRMYLHTFALYNIEPVGDRMINYVG